MKAKKLFLALLLVRSLAYADTESVIRSTDLYAEYLANPLAADAKYEGRRITVSGIATNIGFVDLGVGHIRSVSLPVATGRPPAIILMCFNESCGSFRRPTIPDDQFKMIKEGAAITANCIAEPVKIYDRTFLGLSLSKCLLMKR